MRTRYHCCLDISGGIKNAKFLVGSLQVDGRTLRTASEVKAFLQCELDKGRSVLPIGDCDNFDYQTGCKGHPIPEEPTNES